MLKKKKPNDQKAKFTVEKNDHLKRNSDSSVKKQAQIIEPKYKLPKLKLKNNNNSKNVINNINTNNSNNINNSKKTNNKIKKMSIHQQNELSKEKNDIETSAYHKRGTRKLTMKAEEQKKCISPLNRSISETNDKERSK